MHSSENLDRLSDILLDDQQVISTNEKEFLANLVRRSRGHSQSSSEVADAIVRIAGEILAERACGLVGDRIVRRLAVQPFTASLNQNHIAAAPPRPPTPSPPTPGVIPKISALPPKPPTPAPPTPGVPASKNASSKSNGVALQEKPEILPARCVVMEEFLTPAEVENLITFTLEHERNFEVSEVVSPGVHGNAADFEYRRSHVLMDLGMHYDKIVDRLRSALPRTLPRLDLAPFPISRIEAQITASNDGDFFHWHSDNAHEEVARRTVTFVYFFHREPRMFEGGELRLYDSRKQGATYVPATNYFTVIPRQNQVVLFDSSITHEITPVTCTSRQFSDSRFTVNGWFCQ
jgi:Rps23 Pro-64 3,4-dihydroxylase Tpa1-like proline 4-hydroxylase